MENTERPGWNTKVPGKPEAEEATVSMVGGHGNDQHEQRSHPAFAVATVNRVTSGGKGTRLHGSDFGHGVFVRLEIHQSVEDRHLMKTWRHQRDHVVTVDMSEVQWGQLVSAFGQGGGVPVTMSRREGRMMPDIIGSNDAKKLVNEVRGAADDAVAEIRGAVAALRQAVDAGKIGGIKQALRDTEIKLQNLPANMAFAGDATVRFMETMVGKAMAEIDAHIGHVMLAHNGLLGDADAPFLSLKNESHDRA